jgi:hypothetical protein
MASNGCRRTENVSNSSPNSNTATNHTFVDMSASMVIRAQLAEMNAVPEETDDCDLWGEEGLELKPVP